MMKIINNILATMLLLLTACTSEPLLSPAIEYDEFAYIQGDKVVVHISVDSPDMDAIGSRALSEKPDYNDMHLYLVEFDDNGGPLVNTLKTIYTPQEETPAADKVNYKVMLNLSDQPRILHLIALPKDQELNIDYGVEAQVIPTLKTEKNVPAYWRRLVFPNGYGQHVDNTIKKAEELDQLKHVALIRNFACISITNAENSGFTLTDFAIVNNPEAGTIAPFNTTTYTFPEFLKSEGGILTALDFADVSKNYSGIAPASLTLGNQSTSPVVDGQGVEPKYIYERPFNSIRHTYIILKGHPNKETTDYYYKLDLGKNDANGIFRYYNILRNYNYNITLTNVAVKGYKTVEEAVSGVVYNNFSFDINLSSMLNISDGSEVVYVNFTTAVLTDPEEQVLEFKYRYRSLSASSPTFNNDDVNFIDLTPGTVIKRIEKGTTNDANGWRTVKLYIYGAQTETKTQSFTIVKESGLGRTINLILHRKWTLSNVKEFAGIHEDWDTSTTGAGTAGPNIGDDLTIFFDVPDNLEEAMFPLTFTLEADRQNIENNPLGRLLVTYGTSGFAGLPGFPATITGRRIMYEKTLSWTEYNDPLKAGDPYDNGTVIENSDGTKTHRLRCRFRTTTTLDDFDFNGSVTTVLITNPNFNYATVTFRRTQ